MSIGTFEQIAGVKAPERPMTPDEARKITLDLIHGKGLAGWKVVFDHAKKRAGQCSYRDMTISLSTHLMAHRDYLETLNTITHEVAHAMTPGANHGWKWQQAHKSLGGDGKRVFHNDMHDPKAKFHGTCPHGKLFNRYKGEHPGNRLGCNCKTMTRRTPATHTITWEVAR